jgi:hypothetical protein
MMFVLQMAQQTWTANHFVWLHGVKTGLSRLLFQPVLMVFC